MAVVACSVPEYKQKLELFTFIYLFIFCMEAVLGKEFDVPSHD